ncbi:MAG: hypothetical protein ACQGVC_09560 [Myxococcota bacterium]
MRLLALLTLLVSAADHWTTYLCLRSPVPGWNVTEANPLADWLFTTAGLVPGLMIDSAVTIAGVSFLVVTRNVPPVAKGVFFTVVIAWTSLAVLNNLQAIEALGLSPLGTA